MKKFKKIYLEITNICNLNCEFCIKNKRKESFISLSDFNLILDKIEPYTDYLYFHVLGEPLMHPKINQLIDLASQRFKINITTNGYLIKKIINNQNIRQLNISLHSFDVKYHKSLENYMNDIYEATQELKKTGTYVNYRLWANSECKNDILSIMSKKYHKTIVLEKQKIEEQVFLDIDEEFIWASLENEIEVLHSSCLALSNHFAIHVNGDVVPCCLDSKGDIILGNILKQDLEIILNSERTISIIKGFQDNKRIELLCQKCNFKVD